MRTRAPDWRQAMVTGLAWLTAVALLAADEPMDWKKARTLRQRVLRGERLAPEGQAYFERALALRRNAQQPGKPASSLAPWTGRVTPLTELGTAKYKREDGGLYGGGRNEPPPAHADAAFSVRGLICDQMRGKAELSYDSARGEVKSPLLFWGPYLWADGLTPVWCESQHAGAVTG